MTRVGVGAGGTATRATDILLIHDVIQPNAPPVPAVARLFAA